MANLHLNWLGPPVIELDGRPHKLEMRKTLALLAFLSLSPQNPTRETLATLLWPENDQQHAMANFRRNISSLAKSLPPGILEIGRERIGLRREEWIIIDIEEFRYQLTFVTEHVHPPDCICLECLSALEKAVTLYKGDFLEGFNLKDCPEFDEWQFFQRESLRTEYASALQKLVHGYQEQRKWEKAIVHARSWLAMDCLHEPAHRLLMNLYFLSGQKSAALRQYEEVRQILDQELSQLPELETQRVYEEIRSTISDDRQQESGQGMEKVDSGELANPLLKTKLFVPRIPLKMVERIHLLTILNQCLYNPLTIISAPAGFGKTTLLADWVIQCQQSVAWITVDSSDNDPYRLVDYIINAIKIVLKDSNIGEKLLGFLHSPNPPPIEVILSSLINDLVNIQIPIVLILDDYQDIKNPLAHGVISFLLEHPVPNLHIIIATRIEPPLPLSLMRSRGQLIEIREKDLRFTNDEAAVYLNSRMGLELTPDDIDLLGKHTEGWIVGLQMAAIALQSWLSTHKQQDPKIFIQAFSGSHHYILDYLVEEVLERQTTSIQDFLLNTSILNNLNSDLCNFVIDRSNSQEILERLEKENLFLISLDEERYWYRYHQLFADILRIRVQRSNVVRLSELHTRAAQWYEQHNLIGDALNHALEAHNYEYAINLIEQYARKFFIGNELIQLIDWISQIPETKLALHPKLCMIKGWASFATGNSLDAENCMSMIEQFVGIPMNALSISSFTPISADTQAALVEVQVLRSQLAISRSEIVQALKLGQQVLPYLIENGQPYLLNSPAINRPTILFMMGVAYELQGELDSSGKAFLEASEQAQFQENWNLVAVSLGHLGEIQRFQGCLNQSANTFQNAIRMIEQSTSNPSPFISISYAGLGYLLYEWNDLKTSSEYFQLGIDHALPWKHWEGLLPSCIGLAKINRARGDWESAFNWIEKLKSLFPDYRSLINSELLQETEVAFLLAQEKFDIKMQLEKNKHLHSIEKKLINDSITVLRIRLLQSEYQEALSLSNLLLDEAIERGRLDRVIEIMVLQAIILGASGNIEGALRILRNSLEMGQPEGYIRTFLDEGRVLKELIWFGKQRGIFQEVNLREYVDRLMIAFKAE